MLKTNLATRPFYNESAVQLWLFVMAMALVLATIFNVTRLIQYSRSDTELATQASSDEARTAELKASAAQLRASVDPRQVEVSSVEARLANDLIDRRTFSWTELFNRLETTLPADVRITSVRPHIEKSGRIVLTITVLARGVDDVDEFMESLEATGAFEGLGSRMDERVNEQGQLEASLETVYVPHPSPSRPAGSDPVQRRGAPRSTRAPATVPPAQPRGAQGRQAHPAGPGRR